MTHTHTQSISFALVFVTLSITKTYYSTFLRLAPKIIKLSFRPPAYFCFSLHKIKMRWERDSQNEQMRNPKLCLNTKGLFA